MYMLVPIMDTFTSNTIFPLRYFVETLKQFFIAYSYLILIAKSICQQPFDAKAKK